MMISTVINIISITIIIIIVIIIIMMIVSIIIISMFCYNANNYCYNSKMNIKYDNNNNMGGLGLEVWVGCRAQRIRRLHS